MNYLIRLSSDIGELRIWIATVILTRPINDDILSKVKSTASECPNSLITIVPANKVLSPWHMIYPAYLSLRDSLRGAFRGLGILDSGGH